MVYAQQKFIWNEEGKQRAYPRNYFNTKAVIYKVYKHEPILKNECFLPYILQSYANVKPYLQDINKVTTPVKHNNHELAKGPAKDRFSTIMFYLPCFLGVINLGT